MLQRRSFLVGYVTFFGVFETDPEERHGYHDAYNCGDEVDPSQIGLHIPPDGIYSRLQIGSRNDIGIEVRNGGESCGKGRRSVCAEACYIRGNITEGR